MIETGIRWLGGKTLLTDEIIPLLPAQMHDRFAMVSGPHLILIAVANQGTPLHQALHDYEVEMLRSGFGAARTAVQGMQRRGQGIPFTPD